MDEAADALLKAKYVRGFKTQSGKVMPPMRAGRH